MTGEKSGDDSAITADCVGEKRAPPALSGAGEGIRTPDPFLGKEVLYH